jgi:hypothetical protein
MSERAKHEADIEHIRRLEGLLVGLLDESEQAAFDRLVDAGIAYRSYEGGSGFMGLAKVRFNRVIGAGS